MTPTPARFSVLVVPLVLGCSGGDGELSKNRTRSCATTSPALSRRRRWRSMGGGPKRARPKGEVPTSDPRLGLAWDAASLLQPHETNHSLSLLTSLPRVGCSGGLRAHRPGRAAAQDDFSRTLTDAEKAKVRVRPGGGARRHRRARGPSGAKSPAATSRPSKPAGPRATAAIVWAAVALFSASRVLEASGSRAASRLKGVRVLPLQPSMRVPRRRASAMGSRTLVSTWTATDLRSSAASSLVSPSSSSSRPKRSIRRSVSGLTASGARLRARRDVSWVRVSILRSTALTFEASRAHLLLAHAAFAALRTRSPPTSRRCL